MIDDNNRANKKPPVRPEPAPEVNQLDPTDPRVPPGVAVQQHRELGREFAEAVAAAEAAKHAAHRATGTPCAACAVEGVDAGLGRMFDNVGRLRSDSMLSIIKSLPRALLYQEISEERERQDAEWGGPDHDDKREPGDWADIIGVHASALVNTRIWLGETHRTPIDGYRDRLVKIAALAVAAIESHDRKAKR